MRSVLKTCQLELKVKGPVFVGSGYEIQKKEYILQGHKAGVVNPQKLFMLAKKKHLEAELERFMVKDTRDGMYEKSIWTAVYSRQFDQRDAANHFAVR